MTKTKVTDLINDKTLPSDVKEKIKRRAELKTEYNKLGDEIDQRLSEVGRALSSLHSGKNAVVSGDKYYGDNGKVFLVGDIIIQDFGDYRTYKSNCKSEIFGDRYVRHRCIDLEHLTFTDKPVTPFK